MDNYRIYLTDSNGRIQTGQDFMCFNDAEACAYAKSLLGRYERAEVWIGRRQVSVISSVVKVTARFSKASAAR